MLLLLLLASANPCYAEDGQAAARPIESLKAFLANHPEQLGAIREQPFVHQSLTKDEAAEAIELISQAHWAQVRKSRLAEHEDRVLRLDGLSMPLDWKKFGDEPEKGHCLVISMHGGGGTARRVNDQQWENQKRLYQLDEGIYVAPRAPTDTWNLWHQAHIDVFFTRLIENMIVFEGIDPNRVYITGYSAGGDGTYQLAPRMADQFAAAAMMAGHPNETQPQGLRNLPFTLHVGAKDAAYDRNSKAELWQAKFKELQSTDPAGYTHWVELHEGKGHWMDRQDAKGVAWMLEFRRNIVPERVVWLQDDVLHDRFYWLAVPDAMTKKGALIEAQRQGNTFTIDRCDVEQCTLLLRDDMVDFDQPLTVLYQGEKLFTGLATRTLDCIASTLLDRGDKAAAFSAQLSVVVPQ